jgi:hypothetical protein
MGKSTISNWGSALILDFSSGKRKEIWPPKGKGLGSGFP